MLNTPSPSPKRYTHPKQNRLSGLGVFKAILDRGVRVTRHPIVMCIAPLDARNDAAGESRPRLGISIGRPVGNAVTRNLIKRRLREAFRLMQHDWPRAYDVVLLVRRHVPLTLAEYQKLLSGLMVECVRRSTSP